jgi:hypothetical protein
MSVYGGPDIITDGLVFDMDFGNYKCYPGSGASCYDIAGSSSAGEIINAVIFNTDINNKYFSFDATTKLIKIPENSALNTQTPTVEVWIKTNSTNQNGFFFEKGQVNTQYSLLQESSYIRWRQNFTVGGFNNLDISAPTYINTSLWAQVVGTFTSGSRKIYVNSILINSDTQTGTINTNTNGMSIGVYGGYNGGRGYYYNGNIAIVRVYNKVLTPAEVLNNYNTLKGRFGL